jgi:hypothetical protein
MGNAGGDERRSKENPAADNVRNDNRRRVERTEASLETYLGRGLALPGH